MKKSRWITKRLILASVLLGAMTTIGVAWGLVRFRAFSATDFSPDRLSAVAIEEEHGWGGAWTVWRWEQFGETVIVTFRSRWFSNRDSGTVEEVEALIPFWLPNRRPERAFLDAPTRRSSTHHVHAVGWPFRALYADSLYDPNARIPYDLVQVLRLEHGIELKDWYRDGWGIHEELRAPEALPVVPIPIGFVGNTIIYSVAWWVFFAALCFWRQRRRWAAGRCAACGYDLRGQEEKGCPECGAGRV